MPPRSNHRTAVNQEPSPGTDYPFTAACAVGPVVLDLYLAYEDSTCTYRPPFRVAWLYGFGANTVSPVPERPVPTHVRDVIIEDADGVVVFDSTTADYINSWWGDYREICQWESAKAVLRIVRNQQNASAFDTYIATDNDEGNLDDRTIVKVPKRLRSLRLGAQRFTGNMVITDGYNISLEVAPPSRVDGGRLVTQITINGKPGGGLGSRPGCEETLVLVRRINNVSPTDLGYFNVELDACYRRHVAAAFHSGALAWGAYGLTPIEARAGFVVFDDCKPCCPCPDFVNTYTALRRVHGLWGDTAHEAEVVRDSHKDNIERWNNQRTCRIDNPLRVTLTPQGNCTVAVGAVLCNTSTVCLAPVEIRFSFETSDVAGSLSGHGGVCAGALLAGSGIDGNEAVTLGGKWPDFVATFDYAGAQEPSSVSFRVCLPDCTNGLTLTLTASAHYPTPADLPVDIVLPNLGNGSAFDSAYTTRAVVSRAVPLMPDPQSTRCDCEG
jgi:hypothetical protein